MDLERFEALVESYGAEPDRWPADERTEALLFLDGSIAAQSICAEAKEIDHWLDQDTTPQLDTSLITRQVMENIQPAPLVRMIQWLTPDPESFLLSLWRPALAASMPLLLGVVLGLNFNQMDEYELTTSEEIELLAFGEASQSGWYDE